MKKNEITTEQWLNDPAWAEMDKLMQDRQAPTGPEWFTTGEFMRRYGLLRESARLRLQCLVDDGLAEKRLCNFRGRYQNVYRVLKKAGKK